MAGPPGADATSQWIRCFPPCKRSLVRLDGVCTGTNVQCQEDSPGLTAIDCVGQALPWSRLKSDFATCLRSGWNWELGHQFGVTRVPQVSAVYTSALDAGLLLKVAPWFAGYPIQLESWVPRLAQRYRVAGAGIVQVLAERESRGAVALGAARSPRWRDVQELAVKLILLSRS